MKTTFEICMVDKFKMRITDTTNPEDYLPESQEYSRPTRYKYKDTCTVDIITYKNEVFDSFITTHESALNEVYYTLPIDGNYTIHHLIMPTKEWVDYIKKNQRDFLDNYSVIYYIDNNKIYKYTRTLVKDSVLQNFPYKAKTLDSLDTDTNWYNIRQHSYYKSNVTHDYYWKYQEGSQTITGYKASKVSIDKNDPSYQWCFVKNGDRVDIYNRQSKNKLIYYPNDNQQPYVKKDPLFIGWKMYKPEVTTDHIHSQYTSENVFRLYRMYDNQESYINVFLRSGDDHIEVPLTFYQPNGNSYDYGSDIIASEVDNQLYGNEYIENIEEVDLKELIQVESGVSLVKTQQDTFSICYLNNCFLKICQDIYNNMSFNKCKKPDSSLTFNRDFLWMLINVIKYNLDLGYTMEAQRVLDEFNTCGNNICNQSSNINYGCGCS